jgi:hypothetical protein
LALIASNPIASAWALTAFAGQPELLGTTVLAAFSFDRLEEKASQSRAW